MYFVNFHYSAVSIHARIPAQILSGDGDQSDPRLAEVQLAELAQKAQGRHVFFITHGFNVSYAEGARSLARFAKRLALPDGVLVVGVLWPGDFYIPVVNYPAASVPAMEAGAALGDMCNKAFGGALSLSFFSHSLGARVVLEAVKALSGRKARMLTSTRRSWATRRRSTTSLRRRTRCCRSLFRSAI
jgi:esterase/lipase superfamily enzyme